MNKGIIVGRLVKNPELIKTNNGKSIANITLACNNDKDDTTFLTLAVFGKIAETVVQYCKKGDTLGVEYIVKNHNWQDKSGVKHYDYQFLANRVNFISSARRIVEKQETKQEANDVFKEFGQIVIENNDLPFY